MNPTPTSIASPSGACTTLVISILLTSFIAAAYGFGLYLFAQLLPDMRADLQFRYSAVGTITAAAQASFLILTLVTGWLTPRIGGGRIVIGSVIACGLSLISLPMSSDIRIIGGLLAIMGGLCASVYVPMVEIVTRLSRYEHRGRILGLVSSGTSYGILLNTLLVPLFVAAGRNWRGAWTSAGVLTLVAGLAGSVAFRRVGLLQTHGHENAREPPSTAAPNPSTDRPLKLLPWVYLICAMTFLNGFCLLPFQNYLSPFLREELGFSVTFATNVWRGVAVIGMVAGFIVGWLSDKTNVRSALVLCYSFVTTAALILAFMHVGFLPIIAGLFFSFAYYPIFGLIPAYISKVGGRSITTTVFVITNVTLGVGGILGNYSAGWLRSSTGTFFYLYAAIAAIAAVLAVLARLLPAEITFPATEKEVNGKLTLV